MQTSTPFPSLWMSEKSAVGLIGIGIESVVEVRAFEHPLIGKGRQLVFCVRAGACQLGLLGKGKGKYYRVV